MKRAITTALIALALLFSVQLEARAERLPELSHIDTPEKTAKNSERVVLTPTALGREAGTWNWNTIGFGVHSFDYQISRNFNVGATTVVPIGVLGLLGHITARKEVAKGVHIGFKAEAGAGAAFMFGGYGNLPAAAVYGAGGILTLGSEKLFINFHLPVYSGAITSGEGLQQLAGAVFAPSVAFGWSINSWVQLHAEAILPVAMSSAGADVHFALVNYGVRFSGKHLYGDVFFSIPIAQGSENFLRYMPLGVPGLALGYKW